jgi:ketosteroid isomerase-like protein
MNPLHRLFAIVTSVWLLSISTTNAQEAVEQSSPSDQAAVWATVEEIWAAEERGDEVSVDAVISADFMGWPYASPAPRSKASTRMWTRFNAEQNKGLTHELYPLSIVVHGDVAIAHYLFSIAIQTRDKKVISSNGRYTDVLVRDGTSWKFLSWHGGADNE